MRAVVLNAFGAYAAGSVVEVDRPVPGPNDVVIAVRAAAGELRRSCRCRGQISVPAAIALYARQRAGRRSCDAWRGCPWPGGRRQGPRHGGGRRFMPNLSVRRRVIATVCQRRCRSPRPPPCHWAYDTAWVALRERGRVSPGETLLIHRCDGCRRARRHCLGSCAGCARDRRCVVGQPRSARRSKQVPKRSSIFRLAICAKVSANKCSRRQPAPAQTW